MRRLFKMPPQVLRVFLLAVGIVAFYMVAKYFLTPRSFGEYGWYRALALAEHREHDQVFAGKKACEECHSDEMKKLQEHGHKTLSCETCHGPALAHANNPDVKLEKPTYSQCVRCHEASPSRPKWHKQIVHREHYTGSVCTECHVPHMPAEVP